MQKGHRKEDDFLFGSISAAKHQEFYVTKINRKGKRQSRIFGIDGNNIYNCAAKKGQDINTGSTTFKKKESSFISSFLPSKLFNVKRDIRPINTIEDVRKMDLKTFSITYSDKNDRKQLVYECLTADNCAEILAKLNFLRVS